MSLHVIVGAGQVGSTAATRLAERGDQVRIISRHGGGPRHPAVERVAADATDTDRLARLAEGATALYNCANPRYHRWLTDWPPLAAALLSAAERTGAVLATVSTLYGYGPVSGPMSESTPLAARHPKLRIRADMWRATLAAHRSGRIRATEVRASDYIEAQSIFSFALGKPLLAGTRAWVPAPLDVPHSWTSTADVARLLITVAGDERGHGRAWHVPTNPAMTVRDLATRFTEALDLPAPKLSEIGYPALWAAGLLSPMVRELRTTRYQFTRPFVIDSAAATATFDLKPEPIEQALRAAARLLRGGTAAA